MATTALYIACVIGAAGLYLLLRPGPRALQAAGTVLGVGGLAWLLALGAKAVAPGDRWSPDAFFLLFSLIAVAAAVRMVTSKRPVYCALYFVLVVISSAALFLLLEAEFMAFALVIVYAGAILITYLFVLMLAQQAPAEGQEAGQADYDLSPREPAAAVAVGFVMLAVLGDMMLAPAGERPEPRSAIVATEEAWRDLELLPRRLEAAVMNEHPAFNWPPDQDERGRWLRVSGASAQVVGHEAGSAETRVFTLSDAAVPGNTERVGLALVHKFPASLELAGVILLMAMFGAVVLARRQIELGEDEKRAAAGLGRLDVEALEATARGPIGPGGRA
jgi:NADH-quinone oxidoreductase subunit J